MAESVDRILTSWSIEGTGPLTRGLSEQSTSGWIGPDANHWSIEPFLPIEARTLLDYLKNRADDRSELREKKLAQFLELSKRISDHSSTATGTRHLHFAELYRSVDPDSVCKMPKELEKGDAQDDAPAAELMQIFDDVLTDAGFKKLTQQDIEDCVGVASHWGVPMTANFGLFNHLAVYARGDIMGKRCKRNLRSFYRMEMVDVEIYQRLVVLFQLSEDHEQGEMLSEGQFHLRIFKNIPKLDVDMLLPGTKVRLTKLDQAKVIVPSLGGWLLSLQKISRFVLVTLALAAYYSTALVIGLFLAGIGYLVKSFFSYFQAKNRKLLDLTRNLYFQKLDTNAGAAFQLIQQAGRQRSNESILACYAVMSEAEPISRRRLRRKCERIVREAVEVEIDFQVERAVNRLIDLGVLRENVDGKLQLADTPSHTTVPSPDPLP